MDFWVALNFLTILPAPAYANAKPEQVSRSMAYYPLVGCIIGLILVGLYYLLHYIFPISVVSVLLVAGLAIITGAHHLDGLIDTCDAMVAGRTKEQRLEIMSDTRVGAFGIVGVCLILLTKYAAISETAGFAALITVPVISRWAVVGAILTFPSAKNFGMGFNVKKGARWTDFMIATIISILIAVLCNGLIPGLVLMAGLFALICCFGIFFRRLYGGLTGDCYGALIEIGEALALLLTILIVQYSQFIPLYNLFRLPIAGG